MVASAAAAEAHAAAAAAAAAAEAAAAEAAAAKAAAAVKTSRVHLIILHFRRLTLPLRTPPASAPALVPIPRLSRAHCSPLLLLPSTLLPAPSSSTSPSFTPVASPSLLRQCTRCTKQLPLPPVASTPAPSQSLAYFPLPPSFPSALSSLYISEF